MFTANFSREKSLSHYSHDWYVQKFWHMSSWSRKVITFASSTCFAQEILIHYEFVIQEDLLLPNATAVLNFGKISTSTRGKPKLYVLKFDQWKMPLSQSNFFAGSRRHSSKFLEVTVMWIVWLWFALRKPKCFWVRKFLDLVWHFLELGLRVWSGVTEVWVRQSETKGSNVCCV